MAQATCCCVRHRALSCIQLRRLRASSRVTWSIDSTLDMSCNTILAGIKLRPNRTILTEWSTNLLANLTNVAIWVELFTDRAGRGDYGWVLRQKSVMTHDKHARCVPAEEWHLCSCLRRLCQLLRLYCPSCYWY